ncbi:unnamed protein product [Penicillium camemberti]|uniref:Str. FM013 n=1 Tax=Penicillium camemberti (strain FM 013) TaxID=1429867 RepID=A0A0G4P453_PENC3|nr:unnamed protein product [Penicillium camemberti]
MLLCLLRYPSSADMSCFSSVDVRLDVAYECRRTWKVIPRVSASPSCAVVRGFRPHSIHSY